MFEHVRSMFQFSYSLSCKCFLQSLLTTRVAKNEAGGQHVEDSKTRKCEPESESLHLFAASQEETQAAAGLALAARTNKTSLAFGKVRVALDEGATVDAKLPGIASESNNRDPAMVLIEEQAEACADVPFLVEGMWKEIAQH